MPTNTEQSISYTEPELCTYNEDLSRAWFVYFDVTNHLTGITKRRQFRGGINYWHTVDERKKAGNSLKKFWKKKLEEGLYDPFKLKEVADITVRPTALIPSIIRIMTFKRVQLKPKSFRGYDDTVKMFFTWLKDHRLHKLRLDKLSNEIAQVYLEDLVVTRNYSGKTHNNNHSMLHAIFSEMTKKTRKWISENPFSGITRLPEDIGNNLAYTEEERGLLIRYFRRSDVRMYYAANFLFHSFIRRTELTEIQVHQIDWINGTIRVNSDEVKNRKQDSVTIPDTLRMILLEMGLDRMPGHYYIFGKDMQTCAEKCRPDHLSERHRVLKLQVIAEMKEAGVKCTLREEDGKAFYSWKHTGVVAYYIATKDVYAIMRQCRHHDLRVTMIYLKSLGLMPNEVFTKTSIEA